MGNRIWVRDFKSDYKILFNNLVILENGNLLLIANHFKTFNFFLSTFYYHTIQACEYDSDGNIIKTFFPDENSYDLLSPINFKFHYKKNYQFYTISHNLLYDVILSEVNLISPDILSRSDTVIHNEKYKDFLVGFYDDSVNSRYIIPGLVYNNLGLSSDPNMSGFIKIYDYNLDSVKQINLFDSLTKMVYNGFTINKKGNYGIVYRKSAFFGNVNSQDFQKYDPGKNKYDNYFYTGIKELPDGGYAFYLNSIDDGIRTYRLQRLNSNLEQLWEFENSSGFEFDLYDGKYIMYSGYRYNNEEEKNELFIGMLKDNLLSVEDENVLATNIYPNPSSDNTNIQFTLTEGSDIKISITDALGIEQKVIFDSYLEYGTYNINLRTQGLIPGFYNCVIRDKNEIVTKKFIIMK